MTVTMSEFIAIVKGLSVGERAGFYKPLFDGLEHPLQEILSLRELSRMGPCLLITEYAHDILVQKIDPENSVGGSI